MLDPENLPTLTAIVIGSSKLHVWTTTFMPWSYVVDFKSNSTILNVWALKFSLELNSISHQGSLTLFQPISHLVEYFLKPTGP